MSAVLDSENVFRARMTTLGLEPTLAEDLITRGLTSMSKLAFLCGIQPGVADDKPFITSIYELLTRDPSTHPISTIQLSILRRLWFESHTAVMSEVKHKMEQTEDTLPKKLPLAEREARRKIQMAKLSGVDLSGILEPAHSLVDFVWSLREAETLKYIDPAKCGSRESEIKGVKKEAFLKTDSSGRLVTVNREQATSADTSTEYRLRLALQRRSLAMDQVDILQYSVSERYHEDLFALTMRPVPATHLPISVQQILEADRTVFARCAQLCRDGLTVRAGSYPLEEALREAKSDPVVVSILQPMIKPSGSSTVRSSPYNNYNQHSGKGNGDNQYRGFQRKGDGKGKKGGKSRSNKGHRGGGWLPEGLKGKPKTKRGENICYAYNLGTCPTTGHRCDRGVHVCSMCNENHPYIQCPKKS